MESLLAKFENLVLRLVTNVTGGFLGMVNETLFNAVNFALRADALDKLTI